MRVCELMLRDLTSVDPDDSIRRLVEALEVSATSSVPGTDNDDRLVGVGFGARRACGGGTKIHGASAHYVVHAQPRSAGGRSESHWGRPRQGAHEPRIDLRESRYSVEAKCRGVLAELGYRVAGLSAHLDRDGDSAELTLRRRTRGERARGPEPSRRLLAIRGSEMSYGTSASAAGTPASSSR
jgi:hypothetical protein